MTQHRMFIHIPKSAGMTIRYGLTSVAHIARPRWHKSRAYTNAVRAHMQKNQEHEGFEHARWRDLSAEAQAFECFAIIRNPWARVVSRYFYSQMVANYGRNEQTAHLVVYPKMSFEAFLEERHRWGGEPYYWHRAVRGWYPALDYVTNESGKIQCVCLRCEHLDEDVERYTGIRLPERRRNVTPDTRPYQEMYTPQTKQIVADWYAKDIETWGFSFKGAVTRNVLCT